MDNSTVWQPDYNRQHFQDLYFGTASTSVKKYYEKQSSGPLQRRRRGHRLGQGPVQRGPLRPVQRLPVRRQRLQQHLGPGPRRGQPVGRRPEGRRPHRRADHRRPEDVRPVGPLRLRRRRQLQRARRLHRPLPDRALRRRPGRRRPVARVRTRSGATAGTRQPGSNGPPAAEPARRHPDRQHRHLDRRLHDPAGERRPERLLPRVRPRPRSAGRLRHQLRRRQQQRALDPDGPEPARRQERRGIGERGGDLGAWNKLQLGWLDYETWSAGQNRTRRARPAGVQLRQGPGPWSSLPKKERCTRPRRPGQGTKPVVLRQRRRPQQHDDPVGRPSPAGSRASLTFKAKWDIEDCGPDPWTTPTSRSNDGAGRTSRSPATSPRRPRATASTAPGRLGRRDVRPVGVRGKTIGLRFRYTTDGGGPPAASSPTRSRSTAGGHACSVTAPRPPRRLDAERLQPWAPASPPATTTTTSRATAPTCRTTST